MTASQCKDSIDFFLQNPSGGDESSDRRQKSNYSSRSDNSSRPVDSFRSDGSFMSDDSFRLDDLSSPFGLVSDDNDDPNRTTPTEHHGLSGKEHVNALAVQKHVVDKKQEKVCPVCENGGHKELEKQLKFKRFPYDIIYDHRQKKYKIYGYKHKQMQTTRQRGSHQEPNLNTGNPSTEPKNFGLGDMVEFQDKDGVWHLGEVETIEKNVYRILDNRQKKNIVTLEVSSQKVRSPPSAILGICPNCEKTYCRALDQGKINKRTLPMGCSTHPHVWCRFDEFIDRRTPVKKGMTGDEKDATLYARVSVATCHMCKEDGKDYKKSYACNFCKVNFLCGNDIVIQVFILVLFGIVASRHFSKNAKIRKRMSKVSISQTKRTSACTSV